jgi:hypothetical protein
VLHQCFWQQQQQQQYPGARLHVKYKLAAAFLLQLQGLTLLLLLCSCYLARRESAQRSRARKNDYMRQLEIENQSLKDEVHRLQSVMAAMQRGACMPQPQLSPVMGM